MGKYLIPLVRKNLIFLLVFCVFLTSLTSVGALNARANQVTPVNVDVIRISDGTPDFDGDDSQGNDSSATNNIVRTYDEVNYALAYSSNQDGVVSFEVSMPNNFSLKNGVSSLAAICDAGSSATTNGFICDRNVKSTDAGVQLPFYIVTSKAVNNDVLKLSLKVNGVQVAHNAPDVTVTGAMNWTLYNSGGTGYVHNYLHNGEYGIKQSNRIVYSDPINPDGKGSLPTSIPFSFKMEVPDNAIVAFVPGGITFSQAAPGADVTFTLTRESLKFENKPKHFEFATFIPYVDKNTGQDNLPQGSPVELTWKIKDFDPLDISGTQSNYGSGYAPGFEPGFVCVNSTTSPCFSISYTRPTDATNLTGMVNLTSPLGNQTGVIGAKYARFTGVANMATSTRGANNVYGGMSWDPKVAAFDASAAYDSKYYTVRMGDGTGEGYRGYMPATAVNAHDVLVEYTSHEFIDDNDRRNTDLFNDIPNSEWYASPLDVPGGSVNVSAVRYKVLEVLELNTSIALVFPFYRPDTPESRALAVGTRTNHFSQFGADGFSLVKSTFAQGTNFINKPRNGASYIVNDAHLEAEAYWSDVNNVTPLTRLDAVQGSLVNLKINTFAVGPVGDPATTSSVTMREGLVEITLPNACLEPVASSLASNVTVTPAVTVGADCNIGTPAKISINVGDKVALAGPFDAKRGGSVTPISEITIPVQAALKTKTNTDFMFVASNSYAKSVSSTVQTDITLFNNRANHLRVINAPLVFSMQKSAVTSLSGSVKSNEKFKYIISFANATNVDLGSFSMVDVLPFAGDGRGTAGGKNVVINSVNYSYKTGNGTSGTGKFIIEYTKENPATVLAATKVIGNEGDQSNTITWSSVNAGDALPSGATAIRLRSVGDILEGDYGSITLDVEAANLLDSGLYVNDASFRVLKGSSAVDTHGRVNNTLNLVDNISDIVGKVYKDINFDSVISTEDSTWSGIKDGVELLDSNGNVVGVSDIDVNGQYSFNGIAAGNYSVRLRSDLVDIWNYVSPLSTTLNPDQPAIVDILMVEKINASVLFDDYAETDLNDSIAIEFSGNDIIVNPVTEGSKQGVYSLVTQPEYGSILSSRSFTPLAGPVFNYVTPTEWPTQYNGLSSFVDSFIYSFTASDGRSYQANVYITVHAMPVAENEFVLMPDAERLVNVLSNDSLGVTINTIDPTPGEENDVNISVQGQDGIKVTPSHKWGNNETYFETSISYQIENSRGKTSTGVLTVSIQRAPVAMASNIIGAIAENKSLSFNADLLNKAVLNSASVAKNASKGIVSVNNAGDIVYTPNPGEKGVDVFTISFTDNLGQITETEYQLIIQAAPTGVGEDVVIDSSVMSVRFDPIGATIGTNLKSLSDSSFTQPKHGVVSVDGAFVKYIPNSEYIGSDSFEVNVCDDLDQCTILVYNVEIVSAFQSPPSDSGQITPPSSPQLQSRGGLVGTVAAVGTVKKATLAATGSAETLLMPAALLVLALGASMLIRRRKAVEKQ